MKDKISAHPLASQMEAIAYDRFDRDSKLKEIKEVILKTSARIKKNNFVSLSENDVQACFFLYDRLFFEGFFQKQLEEKGIRYVFKLSSRMTRTGGKVAHRAGSSLFSMTVSTHLLFHSFREGGREVKVGGIVCADRLEGLLRIVEHESLHILEFLLYGRSSCGVERFKRFSKNIFGHESSHHQMVGQEETLKLQYGVTAGEKVSFTFGGKELKGFLHRMSAMASVMVPDLEGHYSDKSGNRYKKYSVPAAMLKKL